MDLFANNQVHKGLQDDNRTQFKLQQTTEGKGKQGQ